MSLKWLALIVLLNIASATQNQHNPPQYPPYRPEVEYLQSDAGNAQRQQVQQAQQGGQNDPVPQQPAPYGQQPSPQRQPQYQGAGLIQPQRLPPGYLPQYGRQPQGQQESGSAVTGGGLFSKLRNSLFAAGSAISDSLATSTFDGTVVSSTPQGSQRSQPSYQQGYSQGYCGSAGGAGGAQYAEQPPAGYPAQPAYPGAVAAGVGRAGDRSGGVSSGAYGYDSRGRPIQQHMRADEETGPGLFGRIKSFLGVDDTASTSGTGGGAGAGDTGFRMPLPPHLQQQQRQQQQQQFPSQYPPAPSAFDDRYMPAPPAAPQRAIETADFPEIPPPQVQQQLHRQLGGDVYSGSGEDVKRYGGYNAQDIAASVDDRQAPESTYFTHGPHDSHPIQAPLQVPQVAPEPQIFTHAGSVVMILRPREFMRKKMVLCDAGPDSVQVFSDFEHVLTSFATEKSGLPAPQVVNSAEKVRVLSSAELLESSGAVNAECVSKINAVADELDSNIEPESADFESVMAKVQAVLAQEGNVHISNVAPVVRNLLPRLGLRQGWKQALQSLTLRGVPTYLFSSGYGDVVAQVILQALYPSTAASSGVTGAGRSGAPSAPALTLAQLPQNLRIISNFFRAAPDGTVRAFSQPIVHERNKNATTAATHMGMPVLNRPYALVLGSHEDDVLMTQGVADLKEQLSIGYLELSEDLPQRLPLFLSTYDAVVVGDGSFEFIRTTIDDILQLPHIPLTDTSSDTSSGAGSAGSGVVSSVGGVAMGLRSRLGQLLNPQSTTQQQQPDRLVPPQYVPQQGRQHPAVLPAAPGFPPYPPPPAGAYPPPQRMYQGNMQDNAAPSGLYSATQQPPRTHSAQEQKTYMDFNTEY